ncbi:MAG TPA: TetR family transcriptional regulator [Iamia sp.]
MPSENVDGSTGDRRTRKREARRNSLLALAADLVEELGPDGLTMAALADAADYAPASLYTYFPSRSALLSSLQQEALRVLGDVALASVAGWDAELSDLDERTAALARLVAFSRLFLSAPDHHPREFRLQQRLLVTEGVEDTEDAAAVVPHAMAVLATPRRLLAAAVEAGALTPHEPVADPLDQPLDGALVRTLAWLVALNGALLVDGLGVGVPTTGALLGQEITAAFLRGWGASPDVLASAIARAAALPLPTAD